VAVFRELRGFLSAFLGTIGLKWRFTWSPDEVDPSEISASLKVQVVILLGFAAVVGEYLLLRRMGW